MKYNRLKEPGLRRWVTVPRSDCEDSCQPQTREKPYKINFWDLIEGLLRYE